MFAPFRKGCVYNLTLNRVLFSTLFLVQININSIVLRKQIILKYLTTAGDFALQTLSQTYKF